MNLRTIIAFLFGQRGAIEAVARNRSSIWTGMVLVLITAIPRNYDQLYILESPFWLIGPLLFSFFSGSFLYLVLSRRLLRPNLPPDPGSVATTPDPPAQPQTRRGQWQCFMGLFWMTAPIAWLYAIPVERIFDSYRAAVANLILLGIVSVWRIWLMSRTMAVLCQARFARALIWVLIAASLETLVVTFLLPISEKRILAAMSGMRHAPEEYLLLAVLSGITWSALGILVLSVILTQFIEPTGTETGLPFMDKRGFPLPLLLLAGALWAGIAILPQREQRLFVTHANLIETGRYRESLDFLRSHSPQAFPPSRRLEPNPYEYRAYEHLPRIIAHLHTDDPEWVRHLYLAHLQAFLGHHYSRSSSTDYLGMLKALARIPGGTEWAQQNADGLRKLVKTTAWGNKQLDSSANTELLEAALARLGIEPERKNP